MKINLSQLTDTYQMPTMCRISGGSVGRGSHIVSPQRTYGLRMQQSYCCILQCSGISPGLGSCARVRGNPEERVMSFQDGEVLGKQKGGVVVREGFLEEVPPELNLEI